MHSYNSKGGFDSLNDKHTSLFPDLQEDNSPSLLEKLPNLKTNKTISQRPESKKSALGSLLGGTNPAPSQSEVLPSRQDEGLVMGNFTVYWINRKDNNKMYQLLVKLPQLAKVQEAIRDVLPYINQRLAEDNSNYILSLDQNLYEFYKAKKSGKPKYDYPSLDVTESLMTTGIQRLTLEEKTSDAVMLRKNKKTTNTMVKSTMPGGNSMISNGSGEEGEKYVYITETTCCCIPVKKKVLRTEKGDLQQRLLQS